MIENNENISIIKICITFHYDKSQKQSYLSKIDLNTVHCKKL